MAEAHLIRKADGSFLPAYDSDYEVMKRVKTGKAIRVSWVQPRNYRNHCRFMAMLNLTISEMSDDISDRYRNMNYLRKSVLISTGYCDIIETIEGDVQLQAKSMSFGAMKEDEFNELYKLVVNYILKFFLPGLDHRTLEMNLKLFIESWKFY